MTQTAKPEITAIAIYKVTTKATGNECYAVPSDSNPGTYYITCWDESTTAWTCTCKAGQFGRSCKHAKAAQVSVLANKALPEPKPLSREAYHEVFDPCTVPGMY